LLILYFRHYCKVTKRRRLMGREGSVRMSSTSSAATPSLRVATPSSSASALHRLGRVASSIIRGAAKYREVASLRNEGLVMWLHIVVLASAHEDELMPQEIHTWALERGTTNHHTHPPHLQLWQVLDSVDQFLQGAIPG
jgi:hypothetical protein